MLFNSIQYVFFFLSTLVVSSVLARRTNIRNLFLLLASFFFYFSNNHWQLVVLLITTSIDWAVCLRMATTTKPTHRKALLAISLVSNLGMLFYFKYVNFAVGNIVDVFSSIGIRLDWIDINIIAPVGISFFTFEALSYTIDVYRGRIPAERQWNRLAFLTSFFPHLISGPIIRAVDFFPQMARPFRLTLADLEEALSLIAVGLLKKIVFADLLAMSADAAFNAPGEADTLTAWLGVYAFTFQIFFDFSGYTDIARGCSKLLGYELPENFLRPYAATSFTDFWRRWHMSLSTWLRDYVYISFGGNRMATRWGVYRNLMLTMLLGGIWHGAAWHFVLWGAIHGALLSLEKAWGGRADLLPSGVGRVVRAFVVLQVVALIWIPFRAVDLDTAQTLLRQMITPHFTVPPTNGMALAAAIMLGAWGWQVVTDRVDLRSLSLRLPLPLKALAYSLAAMLIYIVAADEAKTFIYFQF